MGRKKKGGLANLIWEQPDQQRCDAFGSAPGGSMAFCYKENDSSIYKVKMSLTKNIGSPEKLSRPRPHTPIMWDYRWIIVLREQKKAVQQSFVLLPFTKEIQKKRIWTELWLGHNDIQSLYGEFKTALKFIWWKWSCWCVPLCELSRLDLGPGWREILNQQDDGTPHRHWLRSTGLPEDPFCTMLEPQQWLIH